MISEVDDALRRLLRRDAVPDEAVTLSFDAPTKDWAARRGGPTINVYLYDIREATARREVMWEQVHDADGRVTGRRQPPRHFRLAYLLTAWTQRPEDEHRLLDAALACLLAHPALPPELVPPTLAAAGTPSYLSVALPPAEYRKSSDVWSALGGELKPSLDVQVTAPFETGVLRPAGPPVVVGGVEIGVAGVEQPRELRTRRTERPVDAGAPARR